MLMVIALLINAVRESRTYYYTLKAYDGETGDHDVLRYVDESVRRLFGLTATRSTIRLSTNRCVDYSG